MDKGWKNLRQKKSPHCYEGAVKDNSGEDSVGYEESCRESLGLLRKHPRKPEENVSRNTNRKDHSDEVSDGH